MCDEMVCEMRWCVGEGVWDERVCGRRGCVGGEGV